MKIASAFCALVFLGLIFPAQTGAVEALFRQVIGHPFLSPFPDQRLAKDGGGLELDRVKVPKGEKLLEQAQEINLLDNGGYSQRPKIYFPLSGVLDEKSFPKTMEASINGKGGVMLVGIGPGAADYAVPYPLRVTQIKKPIPEGAEAYLVYTLFPGVVLRPDSWYAAVVMDEIKDKEGQPLTPSLPFLEALANTKKAGSLGFGFSLMQQALETRGVKLSQVRAATVFKTGDPMKEMNSLAEYLRTMSPASLTEFELADDQAHACLVTADLRVPNFLDSKGRMLFKRDGNPARSGYLNRTVLLSIPKMPTPAPGFGTVLLLGSGADKELKKGSLRLRALGAQGMITTTFLPNKKVKKPGSLWAMRDGVRQETGELMVLAQALQGLKLETRFCPQTRYPIKVNPSLVSLWAQAEGRVVGHLFLTAVKGVHGGVLTGNSKDWATLVRDWTGIKTGPLLGSLPKGSREGAALEDHPHSELLKLAGDKIFQLPASRYWAVRPSYNRGPKSVLLYAGSMEDVDMTISAGMDHTVIGKASKEVLDRLAAMGSSRIGLPAKGNRPSSLGQVTALTVLIPEGLSLTTDPMLRQIACFLTQIGLTQSPMVIPPVGSWTKGCDWKEEKAKKVEVKPKKKVEVKAKEKSKKVPVKKK